MIRYCPSCGFDLIDMSSSKKGGSQNRLHEEAASILDDYKGKNDLPDTYKGVEVAKPTYLDNRKRLIQLANRPRPILKTKRMDTEMDKFGDLTIGQGLQEEF